MPPKNLREDIPQSRMCSCRWRQRGLRMLTVCTWTLPLQQWSSSQTCTWHEDIAFSPTTRPVSSPVLALPTFPTPIDKSSAHCFITKAPCYVKAITLPLWGVQCCNQCACTSVCIIYDWPLVFKHRTSRLCKFSVLFASTAKLHYYYVSMCSIMWEQCQSQTQKYITYCTEDHIKTVTYLQWT